MLGLVRCSLGTKTRYIEMPNQESGYVNKSKGLVKVENFDVGLNKLVALYFNELLLIVIHGIKIYI